MMSTVNVSYRTDTRVLIEHSFSCLKQRPSPSLVRLSRTAAWRRCHWSLKLDQSTIADLLQRSRRELFDPTRL